MNLRPRRGEDPEINLISLIDILLVLVLFFLLSTTFSVDGRLRIQLPQASSAPQERNGNEACAGGDRIVRQWHGESAFWWPASYLSGASNPPRAIPVASGASISHRRQGLAVHCSPCDGGSAG